MKKHILELIDLAEKDVHSCPWCSGKKPEEYFRFLIDEAKELEDAFKKKDYENVREELGDIIWVSVVLAHMLEREERFPAGEAVSEVLGKIRSRKPWLFSGKKVTEEEAARLWKEAKEKDKRTREKNGHHG